MRNLYHIPVTQEHLDAGQSANWQKQVGNMAVILHEERDLSKAAMEALRAEGEPVAAVYAGSAVTTVVPDDGQQLAYYWRHDGIALMGACDLGRAAELQPQTALLSLITGAFCSTRAKRATADQH